MDEKEFLFHNDCITKFNVELFDGVFNQENIISKKKAITLGKDKYYGYFLEKNKNTYFMEDAYSKSLPFKILDSKETDYKGDVFEVILEPECITIPAEKRMTFRKLVDIMPAFKHTVPMHFLLYKIVTIASWADRVNYRVSTDAGFGKDSVVNIISSLVNSTANLCGATFAKLEHALTNRYIILNEMGNLKPDDKHNMQEFLLATGAYFNTYNKRSRKTNTTQEQYDISKMSLNILYNLPCYYSGRAQEYFDQMFTPAVINRFIPFVFEGRLSTSFETLIDHEKIVADNDKVYKDVIATLHHYRENIVKEIKYKVDDSIKFSTDLMRYDRSFNILLKYVSEYAEDQKEFDTLSKELYKCYKQYEVKLSEAL